MRVIGCDPGHKESAVIVRDGDRLLDWHIDVRKSGGNPRARDLRRIASLIYRLEGEHGVGLIAVEDVVFMGPGFSSRSLIGTSMVVGAVLMQWPEAVVVRPKRFGKGPLEDYPQVLRGSATDRTRHARAAWDVAGAAMEQAA